MTNIKMRTSPALDALDPLRPLLRELAVLRFSKEQFQEFRASLDAYPGWPSSPTACFLAAKADIEIAILENDRALLDVARELLEESEEHWGAIWEDEENDVGDADRDRLRASFRIVGARLEMRIASLEEDERRLALAEEQLELAERIVRPGGEVRYDDVVPCLDEEWECLRSYQSRVSTKQRPGKAPV